MKNIKRKILSLAMAVAVTVPTLMGAGMCQEASASALYSSQVQTVAIGTTHGVGLNGGKLYVWGSTEQYVCGDPKPNLSYEQPRELVVKEDKTEIKFVAVAAGTNVTAALSEDGNVYVWGLGKLSQPTKMSNITNAVNITCTGTGVLILEKSGSVKLWQWGTGAKYMDINNAVQIAAAENTYMVLTGKGTVYGWGDNSYGQILPGGASTIAYPTQINSLIDIYDIDVSDTNGAAINRKGDLFVWGSNTYGQLGTGNTTTNNNINKIDTNGSVIDVAVGKHTLGYITGSAVYIFGNGEYGQTGNGSTQVANTKESRASTIQASQLNADGSSFVANSTKGSVYFWGRNKSGQSGILNSGAIINKPTLINSISGRINEYMVNAPGTPSSWSSETVNSLYNKGIIPSDCLGRYTQNTTRAEATAILMNAYNYKKNESVSTFSNKVHTFKDIATNQYKDFIIEAYALGIINGTSETSFSPNAYLTREQAAKIIMGVYKEITSSSDHKYSEYALNSTLKSYTDMRFMSSWAKPYIAWAKDTNLLKGFDDNSFRPNSLLTIEQTLVIAERLMR